MQIPDGEGTTLTDHEAWRGFEYRKEDYDAPGGKILQKQVNTPWKKETSKRVRDWGTSTADLTGVSATRQFVSRDKGAGSSWREVRKSTPVFDGYGRPTTEEDLGDTATPADDTCTRTTYADNTSAWILPGSVRTERWSETARRPSTAPPAPTGRPTFCRTSGPATTDRRPERPRPRVCRH